VQKGRLLPFQGIIAYWLKEMGLVDTFFVKELKKGSGVYQAVVRVRPGAPDVLLTEVGFGVSQVLPVLTLLYYVPEGSTVILEQPEIHLHPLAQAGLADVILAVALHRRVQFIVESHSEHLLLRLQRRVAEKLASPDQISLYFCETAEDRSRLVPLDLDLLGTIKNWPKDFFGDAFGEAAAAQVARLSQQSSAA
jgi:predicted ATPase